MLVVWVISNFELEALNYMEHYGLIRVKGEPIEYRHSWDNDNVFTSWAFIEIGRQADHHDRGETHFWELTGVGGPPHGSPNAGIGYYTEFAIALFRRCGTPSCAEAGDLGSRLRYAGRAPDRSGNQQEGWL